ncbi:MAG: FAD-binding oxidoreductase, partial [Lysinibacillus sp.]
ADFIRRPSICFASKKGHTKKLQAEYNILTKHKFPAQYWNENEVCERLPFHAYGALYTKKDAEINPYKFVIHLANQLRAKGLDIFEKTMLNIIEDEGSHLVLHTIEGVFNTKRLVYTTGYGKLPYGKVKGADINRSYAIVTEQKPTFNGWYENALIWETARPYIYMRMTSDQRVIFGGLDEGIKMPAKSEKKIERMAHKLLQRLHELIPNETFTAPFQYSATFGESNDHLPFIGQHPQHPNHYYLLGYGGNGTVYSMLGSKILADLIMGRTNEDAQIVTLDRKQGIYA